MKAALLIGSLFVAFVALEATPRTYYGNLKRGEIDNGYGDSAEVALEPTYGFLDINDPEANYYYNKYNDKNSYKNGWDHESDEVTPNNDSSEQFLHMNHFKAHRKTDTVSQGIVEKIAAFDRLFTKEQLENGDIAVNGLRSPLNVRNILQKNSQGENFNLENTQIENMNEGLLKHLIIDPIRDTMYVQYNFDQLKTSGSFKFGSSDVNKGDFFSNMYKVRSNVTQKLSSGKTFYRPAKFDFADILLTNSAKGVDARPVFDQFHAKYFDVLERTIADEVNDSVNKGLLSKLKDEINTPIKNIQTGQYGKLFDLEWVEDKTTVSMDNIGSQFSQHRDRQMNWVSYTRVNPTSYQLRFKTDLNKLQWTSALTTVLTKEQQDLFKSSIFKVDKITIDVSILKNVANQQCQKVNVDVDVRGFNWSPKEHSSSTESMHPVSHLLPKFIDHALEASLKNYIEQDICFSQKF